MDQKLYLFAIFQNNVFFINFFLLNSIFEEHLIFLFIIINFYKDLPIFYIKSPTLSL
jgi:hypothetical protein